MAWQHNLTFLAGNLRGASERARATHLGESDRLHKQMSLSLSSRLLWPLALPQWLSTWLAGWMAGWRAAEERFDSLAN